MIQIKKFDSLSLANEFLKNVKYVDIKILTWYNEKYEEGGTEYYILYEEG